MRVSFVEVPAVEHPYQQTISHLKFCKYLHHCFSFFNGLIWNNLYPSVEYLTSFFIKIAFMVLKCTLLCLIVRKRGRGGGCEFYFWTNFTNYFTLL